VLVEDRLRASISQQLDQYKKDLATAGITATIAGWSGGTSSDLRARIDEAYANNKIDGAFLVGNLPAAWFRAYTFDYY
jgi:hypothetical protein